MNQKQIEQRGLKAGICINLIMGIAGISVYFVTQIEALFVDAYFTVITLISGLVSLLISKVSAKVSHRFPNGLFILEPIYSFCQSCLTLFLLVSAFIGVSIKAYMYFAYGQGNVMKVGPVIPYELVMVLLSWGLSWYYNRQNSKISHTSTMLSAETKGTLVDGWMSLGIGIVAVVLSFISEGSSLGFLLYTGDFFVTTALVIMTINIPWRIMKSAFAEINGGPLLNKGIEKIFKDCIKKHLNGFVAIEHFSIYKIGMSFRVYVSIQSRSHSIDTQQLSRQKKAILVELRQRFEFVHLELCLA